MVLSHYPKELKQELRNSAKWRGTENNQDMIALLKMTIDIILDKKEMKESAMMIAESDVELFMIVQELGQSLDGYYNLFKVHVNTIDAHGDNTGHHHVVYELHSSSPQEEGDSKRKIQGNCLAGPEAP